MDESTGDAWFYTREGERLGPVPFADLAEQAREGSLNPRLDMVWAQGMEAWKPAGEIEGLFEKRKSSEERESLAPSADPYTPPKHGELGEAPNMEGWPGVNRRIFLLAVMLFPIVWNVIFTMGSPFLSNQFGPHIMKMVAIGAAFLPAVVGIYFSLQRLINLGMSRWWYLANFVPFLNFWLGYRIFACPPGYGYHKKLDRAGVVLAILYWLLVIVAILVAAAFVALLFGAIGSPDVQAKFRDLIHMVQQKSARP